jgi:prepilin-type N-terminal cleavage/methylation domain-containing protein
MFAHSEDHGQVCGKYLWASAHRLPVAYKKPLGAERSLGLRSCPAKCAGFSLLELLVSITILVVISGGVLSIIGFYQKSAARTEVRSDMYENVRGVAELMEQEIGQAGLVSLPSSPSPTLSSAVVSGVLAQTVNVSSTTSMFVGEQLLVDAGNGEELVTLTAVTATTIKAIFGKAHPNGAPISALGVFPSGIVPPGAADPSTANVLNIFGDINADGSLVYVRYTCTPGTSAAPGTLTRSVTTITPGVNAIGASQTLLSTLIGGAGLACFQYVSQASTSGFTFVSNVGFTLSVQATRPDPQTLQYSTMTKSFLNLAPRNVLAGLEWANNNAGITPALCPTNSSCRLQAAPANVSLY